MDCLVAALPQEIALGEAGRQHDQKQHPDCIQGPTHQIKTSFCWFFKTGSAEIQLNQKHPQQKSFLQSSQSDCN